MSTWSIPGLDGSIRAIRAGQVATFQSSGGGYVRRPVEADGLLLELGTETAWVAAESIRRAIRYDQAATEPIQVRLVRRGDVVPLGTGTAFPMSNANHAGVLLRTRSASFIIPMSALRRMLEELGHRSGRTRAPVLSTEPER